MEKPKILGNSSTARSLRMAWASFVVIFRKEALPIGLYFLSKPLDLWWRSVKTRNIYARRPGITNEVHC